MGCRSFPVLSSVLSAVGAMTVGCASPGSSITQTLRVETPGCAVARCELSNDRGQWRLADTPGWVTVATSSTPLLVSCRAAEGLPSTASAAGTARPLTAAGSVVGGTAGAATVGAVFGTAALTFIPVLGVAALLTGAVAGAGAGQSIASRARALTYPELISVPMSCAASPMPSAVGPPKPRLGLDVRGLPKAQGLVAGFGPHDAVLVIAVADHSRAALAGLRSGDILLSANGLALLDPAMLEEAVQAAAPGAPLVLQVWRDGQRLEKRLLMGEQIATEGAKP